MNSPKLSFSATEVPDTILGLLEDLKRADCSAKLIETLGALISEHCRVASSLVFLSLEDHSKLQYQESLLTNAILQALWGSPNQNAFNEHFTTVNSSSRICGHSFSKGEANYQCLDCGVDGT
eukprot:Sdes_comp24288_c0_seq1m22279